MNNYDLQMLEDLLADEFAEQQMRAKRARCGRRLLKRLKQEKEAIAKSNDRRQLQLANY